MLLKRIPNAFLPEEKHFTNLESKYKRATNFIHVAFNKAYAVVNFSSSYKFSDYPNPGNEI